jgi:hypothetical protein
MMVLAVGGGGGGAVSLATIQRIIWSLRCGMAVGGGAEARSPWRDEGTKEPDGNESFYNVV